LTTLQCNNCDRTSHNLASTHKIKLTISPEMDCWSYALLPYTLYFLGGWQVCFLFQLLSDSMKAMSGRLTPLRGHGFIAMVCDGLLLHRYLASSDITQFKVICVQKRDTISPLDSINLPPLFNTPHPPLLQYNYYLWYYYLVVKSFPKQSIILVSETSTPTKWLNNWCKFCLHSLRHWEATKQKLCRICIFPSEVLCVEAWFCQIQSQLTGESRACIPVGLTKTWDGLVNWTMWWVTWA